MRVVYQARRRPTKVCTEEKPAIVLGRYDISVTSHLPPAEYTI